MHNALVLEHKVVFIRFISFFYFNWYFFVLFVWVIWFCNITWIHKVEAGTHLKYKCKKQQRSYAFSVAFSLMCPWQRK